MNHSQLDDPFSLSSDSLHARLVAKHRAEQQRAELQRQRHARIQAANDAVEDYVRKSGTRDRSVAFAHIRRNRPDLFAGMQEPADLVSRPAGVGQPGLEGIEMAANQNSNRNPTTGQYSFGLGGKGEAGAGGDKTGTAKASKRKQYQGKISAGAYFQKNATGECAIAIARETIRQVETVRTGDDQPLPEGADSSMGALEDKVRKVAQSQGYNPDFSKSGAGGGVAIQDTLPVLSKDFNIHSEPITVGQIPDALKEGPVMAAVKDGNISHGELIIGTDKDRDGNDIPNSYEAYNSLNPISRASILDASQIIRDRNGMAEIYALRPYRLGEAHPKSESKSHGK